MAYTYPLSIAAFANLLKVAKVKWRDKRNDELSGTGDGRVWSAELAPPLWTGEVTLVPAQNNEQKQIATKVRKLYGPEKTFMLFDPLSRYPQADPTGSIVGSSTVLVHTVGSARKSLRLKGLPAAYVFTVGDKLQITFSSTFNFFCEVSESVTADGSGVTPEFEIYPHAPVGLVADDAVTVKQPACEMFIMPGTFDEGFSAGPLTEGSSFVAMERRR